MEIEIDGVPARDQFAIGAYSNGGRALVETDRIKRVEVLYGPASVMYGSRSHRWLFEFLYSGGGGHQDYVRRTDGE